ncbi:HmuY family protein [Riemerella columbina]|uniref:HmuY family protein n=1 Tax=Riemerella columbina TaxID=103810 RepID=UPI00266FBBAD|nr:HmuY family protein [Riemerella columbina]WKS94662.1 HmuY family protein [Riemerella columbina]
MKKILFGVCAAMVLYSCSSDRDEPIVENPAATVQVKEVKNLKVHSAYSDGDAKNFTLYSLKENKQVDDKELATAKWDIGFNGTTIIVNSYTRNKDAKGAAALIEKAYEEVKEAPEDAQMKIDELVNGNYVLAIPTGSGKGWYNYDFSTHTITPIKAKTIVIKTAEGKYAKLKIASYYKDAPEQPTNPKDLGYYTFTYAYQTNGSKVFSK